MLDDLQKGLVGVVIVKDLSRFGRDYVMSDYYTEIVFLQYDVQFIAITDHVDSVSGAGMDFLPFHNLMNDWYARDVSKKEKTVILHKGNSGGRLNPILIYGYKKDEDKQWIIDEEEADNVREIFRLFVDERKGVQYIANYLYANKIISPRAYRGDIRKGSCAEKMPCLWSTATIGEILDHQKYCGNTMNFRTEKKSYKSKKISRQSEEDYKIFYDTHPAIIEREMFEQAQEIRRKKQRHTRFEEPALFDHIAFCKDCGRIMYLRRQHLNEKSRSYYVCSGYAKQIKECTSHYITETELSRLVLERIQKILSLSADNLENFQKRVSKQKLSDSAKQLKEISARQEKVTKKLADLQEMFSSLYIDKLHNNITQDVFTLLVEENAKKQSELKLEKSLLDDEIIEVKKSNAQLGKFFTALEKIGEIESLNYDVLHQLVERVDVYEGVGSKKIRPIRSMSTLWV